MKQFRNRRKVISLTLVIVAYSLIVTPLIISNFQKQHTPQGQVEAAQTSRSALNPVLTTVTTEPECLADGTAGIGVLYTNTTSTPVTVRATDQQSNHSVNLGEIMPKETKIGTILTRKFAIENGTVLFTITSQGTNQTHQEATAYQSISCN